MNEQALEYLKSSTAQFNKWRAKNPGMKINLDGADLSDRNLVKANLSHVSLVGASFRGAILDGATFKSANISGADFTRAGLAKSSFDYVKALSTKFTSAQAPDSSFLKATFQDCDFSNADLRRALFTGSDVGGSTFVGASVAGGNFDKTNLADADFVRADFESAVLPFDSVFAHVERNKTRATVSFVIFLVFMLAILGLGYSWIVKADKPGTINANIRSQWLLMSARNAESTDQFEAERAYRIAARLNPKSEEILVLAARFYEKRGEGEKAYPLYKKLLDLPTASDEHRDVAKTFIQSWERR
jgi:tetratricopeptide (TPR) repeat protein